MGPVGIRYFPFWRKDKRILFTLTLLFDTMGYDSTYFISQISLPEDFPLGYLNKAIEVE